MMRTLFDAGFVQTRTGEQTAEAAADHDDVDLVRQRFAFDAFDVRVVDEMRELARDFDVLFVAFGPQALVALLAVFVAQRVRIEAEFGRVEGEFGSHDRPVLSECWFDSKTARRSRRSARGVSRPCCAVACLPDATGPKP